MAETDDSNLPADTETWGPQQQLASTADSMVEFNRMLWEIAKSVFITASILLAVFLVIAAGLLVKFGIEVLA